MPLSIREIRNNCIKARELMAKSRSEKFAVGAFNLDNQEMLKAVCRAALVKKSPVLVEVNHEEAESIGLDNVRDMVDNYKSELSIEIYINLDHSPSVDIAIDGIEAGFEFIQLDVSEANREISMDEFIDKTRQVVNYARLTGAIVESEPHFFDRGSSLQKRNINYSQVQKTFSKAEEAKEFIDATGIDMYAAAIGNLHGIYTAPKVLDIDLLEKIRGNIDSFISLHGGSGTPEHYFRHAIKTGVSKININTDMRVAFRRSLEKSLKNNPHEISVMKLMDDAISSVQAVVEEKIDIFGSAGKTA
ncbi:MAG: class II fructose-bisphosphate aldolase [Candidatus Saccharimonadales bacterium]